MELDAGAPGERRVEEEGRAEGRWTAETDGGRTGPSGETVPEDLVLGGGGTRNGTRRVGGGSGDGPDAHRRDWEDAAGGNRRGT